ncbi:invasion protein CiaB [Helicobacter turcicus]|uniref:Invasion protein CiaB n=1 Tax=Helicobacter turcicus TaxID=2867412 RepID=A0ABS7JKM2_9HELI|nr:invasion protein CiaB [Helicobacter turcicus]MBX7489926.1 invasion protein CiaB [Helicobacter turcicus]MBX7544786.1 invasion protein CiaB [Helicobacter turcicus]
MHKNNITQEKILNDIVVLYKYLESQNKATNALYENRESKTVSKLLKPIFKNILDNAETRFACVERIVGLKEGALLNILQKLNVSEQESLKIRTMLLEITRDFYMQRHIKLLEFIKTNMLLTPFLRTLLDSVHNIGIAFNAFFFVWQKELILGINKDLSVRFKGDYNAILKVLESSMERCSEDFSSKGGFSSKGELSERSYSVPVFRNCVFQAVAYAEFFKEEFEAINSVFTQSLNLLEEISEVCEPLEQKYAHIAYLKALQSALMQKNPTLLLESWRLVDKAWMQISTPLQIGHPLEYYEDHFRKAVAPEWDLRIARIYNGVDLLEPSANTDFKLSKESMLEFYTQYSATCKEGEFKNSIDSCVQEALKKTQSYGGMPLLFYGAELNGLFSAQVVPNDEKVSAQYGKKIFYFPDRVRELSMAKPFMLLSSKTFPKEFLDFNRELLYFRKRDWYKIYEISTIGHEFGHILWVDLDSELQMNASGQFKNIEEFKATMGGLAYYLTRENKPLLKELVFNTISRAVGLIAWMEEGEVLPYYCEGLIHLQVLFDSGILHYKGSFDSVALEITLNNATLKTLEQRYLEIYNKLITIYLNKSDAKEFLTDYIQKDSKGNYKPRDYKIRAFVEDYYAQYQAIGQVQDPLTSQIWQATYKKDSVGGDYATTC